MSTNDITPDAKTGLLSEAAANTVSSSTGPRPSPRDPAVTTRATPAASTSPTTAPGTPWPSRRSATITARSTSHTFDQAGGAGTRVLIACDDATRGYGLHPAGRRGHG